MGYSNSKKAIERVQPILDVLLSAEQKLFFPSKHPQRLAYAIRDGINNASRFASFAQYAVLKDKFKIRIKPDGVSAEPRAQLHYEDPIIELAQSLASLAVPDVNSVLQVVGAAIKHKAPELIFPDAALDDEAVTQLRKWTNSNNYTISNMTPLTLTKNEQDNTTQNGGTEQV